MNRRIPEDTPRILFIALGAWAIAAVAGCAGGRVREALAGRAGRARRVRLRVRRRDHVPGRVAAHVPGRGAARAASSRSWSRSTSPSAIGTMLALALANGDTAAALTRFPLGRGPRLRAAGRRRRLTCCSPSACCAAARRARASRRFRDEPASRAQRRLVHGPRARPSSGADGHASSRRCPKAWSRWSSRCRADLMAPNGFLHAGTVVSLADTAAGYACVAHLPEGAESFTTLELKANLLGTTRQRRGARRSAGGASREDDAGVGCDVLRGGRRSGRSRCFRCTQMILYPRPGAVLRAFELGPAPERISISPDFQRPARAEWRIEGR